METGIVTIQEPVSTKTNVGEAPAGVIVDKVNLSTVLDDDEITREADVSDVVNGSGNKETKEFESNKRETTLVEDSKIVKGKATETEKDEQGSIFVHEPESFNKSIEDEKIILSDVTLEKEKEDNLTQKPEEVIVEKPVIEEDQAETKQSQEQEEEIDNISKAREEIPIKTDELKEETDSRTVETSVNGTEAEDNATVLVEEISRNGVNIVNETVPEKETKIDGEPLHEIETTKKPVNLEAEKEEDKEEMKIDEQPRLNAIEKVEKETVKTVIEDSEIVNNEEPTVQESQSLKENEEPTVQESQSLKENEAITQNTEEVQESPRVIETPTIQGEDIESKASLEVDKISKDTEEHEHVLVRDIPQGETLVTEAETVDTSTVQDAGILKTNINETEAMHSATGVEEDGQETKENTKPSQDLKEDKEEEEETETVKTIMTSDEVRSSDVQAEVFGEHTEPCSSEIKDESQGRENSVEVESTEDLLDVPSTESEKNQDNEPETTLVADSESREKFEKSPSDLALNVDKEELKDEMTNVDQVDGTQIIEEQRGLDSNGTEAEQIDRNRTDETEEMQVALPDVESVDHMQKPTLESPSEVSEESSKTVDEKTGKKQEEEVTPHQEGEEEGSYGLETKEETVSVPKSSELREERNVIDLNPLQEESSQQNEQDKETKLEQHEPIDEEVKSDEVTEVSSASPSNELEGETVVEAGKIENIKENEEEQAADKIPKSLETVESHGSLPSSSVEHEHGTVSENIEDEKVEAEQTRDIGLPLTEKCSMDQTQPEEQVKETCSRDEHENEISKNSENIVNETYALHSAEAAEETATNGESLNDVESTKRVLLEVEKEEEEEEAEMKTDEEPRLDAIEKEEIGTVKTVVEDAKSVNNEETTAHESESLKGDDHQDQNAESVEAIRNSDDAVEEVKESPQVIETPTVQGEDIESKASLELKKEVDQSSKDTEEHVLGRDIPQCDTLEVEAVDTSTAQEAAVLMTLETNINEAEDKEQKETETVKDVIFSDEVTPSDQVDAHTEACSSEVKDESQGRDESVEVNYKESVQDESSEEKDVNLLDVRSGESEKYQDDEPETSLVSKTESRDKFEDIPSAVEGAGLDEPLHKQTLVDVESVEKVQKPYLETPSEPSEETSTTVYEKVEDSPKEEVTLHQEGQEEVTVSVPESKNLGEQAEEEESCLPNEKEIETKLQKEKIDKYEPTKEEVSSASLSEGPEGETVVEAKKIGDKNIDEEEQVEPHSSLPSSSEEQEHGTISEKTDNGNGKETTDIVALPLEEQEKVTSTEKGETKENETEDDKPDEHVDSSTSPMLSEKNDDEALTAEEKKEDDEITVGTLNTSENVCMQQEEFGKLETPKLEESKEDKSQEIAETIKEIEATSDQTLPIEASQIDNTPSSELVTEQEDQTPKVEDIHEEETKEAHNLNSEEILPTEIIPRDSSDRPLASMLASKEDGQMTLQVDNCAEDIREANDTQEEQPVSAEPEKSEGDTKPKEPEDEIQDENVETPTSLTVSEKNDDETLIVETKKEDENMDEIETPMALESSGTSKKSDNVGIKQEQFGNHEVPKLEESKDEKSQELTETAEAIEATGDQTLPIETSQVDQTLSSELVSGLDDQTPRKVEEIHEEEAKEERKFEATCNKSIPVETSQECQTPSSDLASGPDDQTPKQVEEVHEEETKEEHKLQVACDKILPVETSQIDEILEEETRETHKVQAEDILSPETVPRESFSEAPVSMLASGEDEPVTPQEGKCTGDTQEEQHVSAERGERVEEPKLNESEAEGTEKSNDQVETSIKLTNVEDESAKKADVEVEVAELTNDYPTEEAEHGDETYSTLPVVGILTELHTTLENERTINDSASSGENMIKEPADQEQKKGDVEVESNEDFVSKIIEANRLQQDQSGETEKIQEENGLAGKSLPVEEVNLQEEDKEEVKVQDDISRAFEVSAKEKLQKEEIRETAEKQEESKAQQDASLQEEHPRDLEISKQVGDNSDQVMESKLPADQSQTEQKTEIHETVKEEDQIVDFKEVKKSEDVHDEKVEGLSATTDTEETFSSQVKKGQEDASELGVGHDSASPQVEKEEEPHNVLGNDEQINEVVTSEKQIIDPVVNIKKVEHGSNEEHIQPQAISDDTESLPIEEAPKDQKEEISADKSRTKEALDEQIQVPSSALLDDQDLSIEKPSELIQPHQSPNQVEETSFEVKKAQEDITEETVDALITNENVQVQDQPKDFEAPAKEKETSEHKQKSNDLTHVQEDIGTIRDDEIKGDGHDSVAELKEETCLTEGERELDNVKTELEDATKHEVSLEEKNNTSENIDGEATKEINQEESKQTYAVKEEIREEEKETNQESFNNLKKTDEAIDKTQPEISEIERLSSVSKTHEKSEQKDEVSKLENPKIAEELQKKDRESENNKDLLSEVNETEPTLKEPARKSLSDLIQKVKGTNRIEDATTTEPHIEEEPKTEEEEDDGDHEDNKDDKTSPDSLVMVEAKDTVSIIKTHKKSHGILSQVKHSISKVKKVLTGKSSHTTKPSSPT